MTNLERLCKEVLEASEKATEAGKYWTTKYGNAVQSKEETICVLNDGEYIENPNRESDAAYIILSANNAPLLAKALLRAMESLKRTQNRFLNEAPTGLPLESRGPSLAWAMMSDCRKTLADLEKLLGGGE